MNQGREQGVIQSAGGRLIFVITLLLVAMMAARTPLDSDLWWHLRAGQVTIETGHPLVTDLFSYTRDGQSWVNHSWLSQVILYGLFRLANYTGLSLWVTVLAVVSLTLVFFQMKGPAWWRSFLVILGAVAIAPVWSPRPQVASLAMFALLAWLLERWKKGKLRSLWLLPLLFMIWSNLHGGYSLGFLLMGAFLGGQVLNHAIGLKEETLSWRPLGRILIWTVLAFLAVAINPNGLDMWRIPFQTVSVGSLQQFIQEWASPDFHDVTQQPVLILIFLLIGVLGLSGRKMNAVDWLYSAGFLILALVSRRNIAPFALITVPIISHYGWIAVQDWRERVKLGKRWNFIRRVPGTSHPHPWLNLALVGMIGFVVFTKQGVVTLPTMVQSAEAKIFPQGAVEWLKSHPAEGRSFSEYSWGGYLVWHLPEEKVFVDGRTDLFGDEIISEWRQVEQAEENMSQILDQWGVDRVVLMPTRPAVTGLKNLGWKVVFQNRTSIVLERGGH
jgi:hypothetical protein